jgi:uncharacterized protein (UPF0332 family)
MDNDLYELSKYRLTRAKEDLEHAKVSLKESYIKGSLNRSYYAIFHAMRAVLALDGLDSKKHSGIIAHFNQNYIKTGVFSRELSKYLARRTSFTILSYLTVMIGIELIIK